MRGKRSLADVIIEDKNETCLKAMCLSETFVLADCIQHQILSSLAQVNLRQDQAAMRIVFNYLYGPKASLGNLSLSQEVC